MNFNIAVLPGDGVGPEVTAGAVKVLEAVGRRFGHAFDFGFGRVGGNAIDESGTALPDETFALCQRADAVLFGAVGGPKWDDPKAEVRPEDGILALRKRLGLFANLRPVKVFPAVINSSPVKPQVLQGVDMLVVRELTGGLYFARPKRRWRTSRGRRSVDTLRLHRAGDRTHPQRGIRTGQCSPKAPDIGGQGQRLETSRLWREVAVELGRDYPDVELEHMLVDNAAMQLIRNPSHFDVIVAENTFGDILTDEASVLLGSMGMLPSASLAGLPRAGGRGRRAIGLYEPIHGSAPDIAGRGVANPIGAILSAALLLRYSLGLGKEAGAVERSVEGVLAEGYRTVDIAADGGEVLKTSEMGDIIAARV